MERKLSALFGRKESYTTGNGQKKNVIRYAAPGSPNGDSNAASSGSTIKVLSPRSGGGSGLGFSLFRKFSSSNKSKNEKQFDMGIDPQQRLDDTSVVSKSIKMNLNLEKLQEIAGENAAYEFEEVDVSELEDKFGVKIADANELIRIHAKSPSVASEMPAMQRKVSDINLSSPKPLRERVRMFYEKHDKSKVAKGLDTIVQFAAANGVDALNEQLKSKYGETLDDVSPIQVMTPTQTENPSQSTAPLSPEGRKDTGELAAPPGLERKNTNNPPPLPPKELFRGDSFLLDSSSATPSVSNSETSAAHTMTSTELSDLTDFDGPVSKFSPSSEEYKALKGRLIDYFIKYDANQTSSDELSKAVHWGLNHTEEELDLLLRRKYGKGLLEFEAFHKVKEYMAQAGIHIDEHGPCDDFQLDTTKAFGTCKCNHPKSEHKNANGLASPKSNTNVASPSNANSRKKLEAKHDLSPTPKPKTIAPPPALKIPSPENAMNTQQSLVSPINRKMETGKIASPNITALRKRAPSKENAAKSPETNKNGKSVDPCSNYRLDMSGSSFGVCICGHPKVDHKIGANKGKEVSELDKKLAARNGQ